MIFILAIFYFDVFFAYFILLAYLVTYCDVTLSKTSQFTHLQNMPKFFKKERKGNLPFSLAPVCLEKKHSLRLNFMDDWKIDIRSYC